MALFTRVCTSKHSLNGLFNRLCKVSNYNNMQVAYINGRMNRIQRPRPPPFPYRTKEFTSFDLLFDYTIERFDENSRIIVVEGPIAAGKDKFARELAIELEMGYMPPPSFDQICVDAYGNDVRTVDHLYPKNVQICDIERFLTNPRHANVAAFAVQCYVLKVNAYIESLLHVLSTGEGVVINRCAFSNYIFMRAMYKAGYINPTCRNYYDKVVYELTSFLMRPHLVIYLDIPVTVVQERIKERCIPYEVNSKVLTKEYLTNIENLYKEEFLPDIAHHAYLLMYDWADCGDMTEIVEDIERVNLEYDKQYPNKLEDWVFANLSDLQTRRLLYSREKRNDTLHKAIVTDYEVTEMFLNGEGVKKRRELYESVHEKYTAGYNPSKGDKVLWKHKDESDLVHHRVITHKELLETQ